jgi:hypothetical protein
MDEGQGKPPTLSIVDLPREVITIILEKVDDVTFVHLCLAHSHFCIHSRDEVQRLRKVAAWRRNPSAVCARGDVDGVSFLASDGHLFEEEDINTAIARGHAGVLEIIQRQFIARWRLADKKRSQRAFYGTVNAALLAGDAVDVIKVLFDGKIASFNQALIEAARRGRVRSLAFLYARRLSAPLSRIADVAIAAGHVPVVQYLWERSRSTIAGAFDYSPQALVKAAAAGHLDMLRWLGDHSWKCDGPEAADTAATAGHLNVLEYLYHERRLRCSPTTWERVCANGHVDIVDLLCREHGHEALGPNALAIAAHDGHLGLVEYLYAKRHGQYTADVLDDAAIRGHLDVVKFLWERRIQECTANALWWPTTIGHLAAAVYLACRVSFDINHDDKDDGAKITHQAIAQVAVCAARHNYHQDFDTLIGRLSIEARTKVLATAARACNLVAVRLLLAAGCTHDAIDQALILSCGDGHDEIVQCLHDRCDADAVDRALGEAARMGRMSCVATLMVRSRPDALDRHLVTAAANGHFGAVALLHSHRPMGISGPSEPAVIQASTAAASQRTIDMLACFVEQHRRPSLFCGALYAAARAKRIEAVGLLADIGVDATHALETAAASGACSIIRILASECNLEAIPDCSRPASLPMSLVIHTRAGEPCASCFGRCKHLIVQKAIAAGHLDAARLLFAIWGWEVVEAD